MRTVGVFNSTTTTTKDSSLTPPSTAMQQRSQWHSPVPYLFGGLAAMLGLIAFALLILACSYWRLSGGLDDNEGGDRGLESGKDRDGDSSKSVKVNEEKILVIMAGNEKPTFLATPVSGRASSFGDKNGKTEKKGGKKTENGDKMRAETDDQDQTTAAATEAENRETQQAFQRNQ